MKTLVNCVIATAAVIGLTGCLNDDKSEAVNFDNVLACAFPSATVDKSAACGALSKQENKLIQCAFPNQGETRKESCKDLDDSELKLVARIDANRPVGTKFDLGSQKIRKMGE